METAPGETQAASEPVAVTFPGEAKALLEPVETEAAPVEVEALPEALVRKKDLVDARSEVVPPSTRDGG